MAIFDVMFPPLMILLPLLMVLFTRRGESTDERRARAKRLTGWLLLATAGALGAWLVCYLWIVGEEARHFWFLAAPLFPLAMRITALRNMNMEAPHVEAPVRAASLTSRAQASALPRWSWGVVWLLVFATIGAMAARWTQPFTEEELRRWWVAALIGGLLLPVQGVVAPLCLRLVLREPEPMDAAGSPELREAYRRHRSERMWGLFALVVVMTAVAGGAMVALAWVDPQGPMERQLGWWGAGVGCTIGAAGAIFGTWSGMRRARINGMVRERMRQQSEVTG